MKRTTITTISVLVLLLATSAGATRARQKTSAKCTPGHAHLIAADSQAQIYAAPTPLGYLEVYGCTYGKARSYRLGSFPECGTGAGKCTAVQREAVAGSIVAYEEFSVANCCNSWLVVVRDLRNGRVLHRVPTGTHGPTTFLLVGAGFTTAIVVKSNGAVAWVVEKPAERGTEYEVHALDKNGNRLLASGTDIYPHSLALAGSTLYWTQGGKPFSAMLN